VCSNYGLACGPLGKVEEAEEAFLKALRIHETNAGPESLQVSFASIVGLFCLYRSVVPPCFLKALKIHEANMGPESHIL
jgi:hypothetical protein